MAPKVQRPLSCHGRAKCRQGQAGRQAQGGTPAWRRRPRAQPKASERQGEVVWQYVLTRHRWRPVVVSADGAACRRAAEPRQRALAAAAGGGGGADNIMTFWDKEWGTSRGQQENKRWACLRAQALGGLGAAAASGAQLRVRCAHRRGERRKKARGGAARGSGAIWGGGAWLSGETHSRHAPQQTRLEGRGAWLSNGYEGKWHTAQLGVARQTRQAGGGVRRPRAQAMFARLLSPQRRRFWARAGRK